jgi:hypothetical protein
MNYLKISWNINFVNDIFFDSVENLSMHELQIDKATMRSSILIVELVCFIEFDSNLSRNCANKHESFISRCCRNWRVRSKSLSKWVWYVVFTAWSLQTDLSDSLLEYSWDRLVKETTNRELNASLCFDNWWSLSLTLTNEWDDCRSRVFDDVHNSRKLNVLFWYVFVILISTSTIELFNDWWSEFICNDRNCKWNTLFEYKNCDLLKCVWKAKWCNLDDENESFFFHTHFLRFEIEKER